ncbi:MAG: hypothetical protein FWH20_08740 [Oscillospiraceae bacterium]|nr:hypothetical protein [Oscillospiraceae bacterium]
MRILSRNAGYIWDDDDTHDVRDYSIKSIYVYRDNEIDFTFNLGNTPHNYGGVPESQWLWGSRGTDGDTGRRPAWQYQGADGLAIELNRADLDLGGHIWLYWTGDGANLLEGYYNPYGIDFSRVKSVRYTFEILNEDILGEHQNLFPVANFGGSNAKWKQEMISIEELKANNWTYTLELEQDFPADSKELSWFQVGVANWDGIVGIYNFDLLDVGGNVIELNRHAQVQVAGNAQGGEWFAGDSHKPSDFAGDWNFTGANLLGAGTFTVKVGNMGLTSGANWSHLAVYTGDKVNLREYSLTAISAKIDNADTPANLEIAALNPQYSEIVLYSEWWTPTLNSFGTFVKPTESIEITFTLQSIAQLIEDDEDFAGFEINYSKLT